MKTTIELSEDQASALTELGKARHVSTDEVIRQVISEYLGRQPFGPGDPAFGMWKGRGIDGVEYQRRIRAEWDHRS